MEGHASRLEFHKCGIPLILMLENRCASQVYFRHNPQMTLGQRMTLGGQIAIGKVRSDSCESFGVIFGALAPLGEPQSAVQI